MLEIELPYPPSINRYWRHVGAKVLISREGRNFRKKVVKILEPLRLEPFEGSLAVIVEVYPPDRRRRDIDNLQKALFDALQAGGAYLDDSQIDFYSVARCGVTKNGKTIVRIQEMGQRGKI